MSCRPRARRWPPSRSAEGGDQDEERSDYPAASGACCGAGPSRPWRRTGRPLAVAAGPSGRRRPRRAGGGGGIGRIGPGPRMPHAPARRRSCSGATSASGNLPGSAASKARRCGPAVPCPAIGSGPGNHAPSSRTATPRPPRGGRHRDGISRYRCRCMIRHLRQSCPCHARCKHAHPLPRRCHATRCRAAVQAHGDDGGRPCSLAVRSTWADTVRPPPSVARHAWRATDDPEHERRTR